MQAIAANTWLMSMPHRYAPMPCTGTRNQIMLMRIRHARRLIPSTFFAMPSPFIMLFRRLVIYIRGQRKESLLIKLPASAL